MGDEQPAESLFGKRVGNFVVERQLGRGGMGVVYLLRHEQLPNTFAALKVLRRELADAPSMRGRFVQEALVAAALGGHRVARPLDLGRLDDGSYYIVMEYVAGRTLADHLDGGGALPLRTALKIAYRVADTMALAHARGILHRDLKPSNVMLVGDDVDSAVKLLDFGVARAVGAMKLAVTVESAIIGSPGFMSPEAATGLAVDGRTDVFSLGVTLYQMLTGALPFAPALDREAVAALLAAEMPPISSKRPAGLEPVSAEIEALTRRALAKDAEARPTMAELRDALLDALRAQSPDEALSVLRTDETPTPPAPANIGLDATLSIIDGERPPDLAELQARLEKFSHTRAPDATPAVAKAPPRRGWLVAAAVVVLIGSGLTAWRWSVSRRSPLFAKHARLACPPLEAIGVEPPNTWLGAAAATEVAKWADRRRSEDSAVVLWPAELLDLPRTPSESFPSDPYGDPNARDRAVAAARLRADAYLDGSVTRKSSSFEVSLVLRRSDQSVLATATAQAPNLRDAAMDAVDALDRHMLPHATRLPPELARWSPIADLDMLRFADGSGEPACKGVFANRSRLGRAEGYFASDCSQFVPDWVASLPPPQLDASSPAAKLATARDIIARSSDPAAWQTALKALDELLAAGAPAVAEADIFWIKSVLFVRLGRMEEAHEAALTSVKLDPTGAGWTQLSSLTNLTSSSLIARAASAWMPSTPVWWARRGSLEPQEQVRFTRRAFELEHDDANNAVTLGRALVAAGRPQEARLLAASYSDAREDHRELRAYLLGMVELAEARFGAGFQRLRSAALARPPGTWSGVTGSSILRAMNAGSLLGQDRPLADEWVARYVLPGRDDDLALFSSLMAVIPVCLRASPSVAAQCAASLRSRFDRNRTRKYEWLNGSDHLFDALQSYARGDLRRTGIALRKLAGSPDAALDEVPVALLRAAGVADLIEQIDNGKLSSRSYGGISDSTPRVAERAFRRGDTKRARELALEVVDKWGNADVVVPAVAEMRTLLAKLR